MKYAKIVVRTANGFKTKYVKFTEEWKFGRYLCRYYKGKEYEHQEVSEVGAKMLEKIYHREFLLVN
jgi:hypothetical protein